MPVPTRAAPWAGAARLALAMTLVVAIAINIGSVSCEEEAEARDGCASNSQCPAVVVRGARTIGRRRTTTTTTTVTSTVSSSTTTTTTTGSTALQGWTAALVTSDCVFEGYAYAVDIYWSCGSERFNQPLRLHTFKKHAHAHAAVFADQKMTMEADGRLWFRDYSPARCIAVGGDSVWRLSTLAPSCSQFDVVPHAQPLQGPTGGFQLRLRSIGQCASIGGACSSRRHTGGYECGGVRHMYLDLTTGACGSGAITFTKRATADFCSNERPGSRCFNLP